MPGSTILRLVAVVVATAVLSARAVTFDAPGHVAEEGLAVAARGGKPGSSWKLIDWRGRPADCAGVFGERGDAMLPPLPAGYYWLVGSSDRPASLAVVRGREGNPRLRNSFYGVMSGQSVVSAPGRILYPWNGGDTFCAVSDLLRISGVPNVRDFTSWKEVHPMPGVSCGGKYLYNAELLHERGIGISGMLLHCPEWTGRMEALPSDLASVHDSCRWIAADFRDLIDSWEFWNEEDIAYAPEPVWDYAAALKAAFLGFKAGHPGAVVLHGALALSPDSPYSLSLYENDAAKFSDAFNWHTYAPIASYPGLLAKLRSALDRAGIGDRAVWITESGTNLEGPASDEVPQEVVGRLQFRGVEKTMGKLMAHSPEQELVVAEFYPKSQIELQMEGVSRNYFFVFGAYNERGGSKDWGVLRRDGTAKPAFAAVATMMRELSEARIVGRLNVGDGLKACLFDQPDGSQTVVFWAVSPLDAAKDGKVGVEPDFATRLRLKTGCGDASPQSYPVSDLCGMVSQAKAENGVLELEATRFPAYVSGLCGLDADVRASTPGKTGATPPAPDEDLTVVLRAVFDPVDFTLSDNKTRAVSRGASGRVRVQVWNLGDESKSGRVEADGCSVEGLPERIDLGPRGTPPAEFVCTMAPTGQSASFGTLSLTGVFNGRRSSRLSAGFAFPAIRFAGCRTLEPAWRNPSNWKRNDSADGFSVRWDGAEKALRFDVVWNDPDSDRWFYPAYVLEIPDENLDGAIGVRFEVKSSQDKAENDFKDANLMLEQRSDDLCLGFLPPSGDWESRTVFLDDSMSPGDTAAIRIGANPRGMRLTFWIRDLQFLKRSSTSGNSE